MRLDKDWKSFLRHWNQPVLRMRVAECMPHLVVLTWTDDFLLLPRKNIPFRGLSMLGPVDEQTITSTRNMLNTILTRTRISSAAMLLSLLLVHRYRMLPNTECGMRGSEFRTFVVALLLAHKYTEDHPYSNRIWSQLSEIPVRHINALEREFLHCIDHRLGVRFREFQRWVVALDAKFGWTNSVGTIRQEYRVMPLPPKPDAVPPITIPQPAFSKYRRLSHIRPLPYGDASLLDGAENNQPNIITRADCSQHPMQTHQRLSTRRDNTDDKLSL